ncbi:hypothetical protein AB0L82_03095 [Nocardia sp. NPDC052001]|uniref:hypothetical protein n=1 Tax=Nocardia sp. NPDC052001 TaxID=3154853 RepID=UPI00343553F0
MLMQLLFVLVIGGALIATITMFRRGRGSGPIAEPESGFLYVTGVSPLPNASGEQYVTISGSISGPMVVAHEVYGRFAWDVNQWPAVGDQIPVTYPAGKPDRWQLAHPGVRPYFGSRQQRNPGN